MLNMRWQRVLTAGIHADRTKLEVNRPVPTIFMTTLARAHVC